MLETNRTSKAFKQINSAALNSKGGRRGRGFLTILFLKLPRTVLLSHFGIRKFKKEYMDNKPLPPLPRLLFKICTHKTN